MRVVHELEQLPEPGCVLVPTMGALHEGHLSLVRLAREHTRRPVVVSIFVNPTQFNDPEDLRRYPRDLERDARLCASAGADFVFAPTVETVYPAAPPVPVPPLPTVATEPKLEDAGRPGHFQGVCQVVSRLFDLCRPAAAVFGAKDWQQLQVVRAMIALQGRDIEIIEGDIVREPDGLAMSSRNKHLAGRARKDAIVLRRALDVASQSQDVAHAEQAMRETIESVGAQVAYAVVRDAHTLMPIHDPAAPARALVSAIVGGVRLLDNAPWGAHGERQPRAYGFPHNEESAGA